MVMSGWPPLRERRTVMIALAVGFMSLWSVLVVRLPDRRLRLLVMCVPSMVGHGFAVSTCVLRPSLSVRTSMLWRSATVCRLSMFALA